MTDYADAQWFLDLNIVPDDACTLLTNHCPPEKTLSEHIDGVTECMKRFAKETEDLKTRHEAQARQLNALDAEMEKVVNHMTEMQSAFNSMRATLKEVIVKVDPGWKVATPHASGAAEEYGPFEMAY